MKTIKPVAYLYSDFSEKFGVPRQSGMTDLPSKIVFEKEFTPDSFRGIEEYDYVWLIWDFDKAKESTTTVRPPRLGGNKRMGVFATRSPFRPNTLGLSSVKLLSVSQENGRMVLTVAGADIVDGTPVYDVKPYLPYTDSHEKAKGSFGEEMSSYRLSVDFTDAELNKIPEEKREELIKVLSLDPRPSYQSDERVYGFTFAGFEIKFSVNGDKLTVTEVLPL